MKRNTQAEKKIIDFLLDHAGQKFYLTQIAKELNISDSTIWQILRRKEKEGLVKKEKLGNLSLYFVDSKDPTVRQRKILRTTELLKPLINELKNFSQKIILYGSCARGEDSEGSDIDLFVLSNEPMEARRIIIKHIFKRKIQAVIKDFTEWVKLKEKDKFFSEEIKSGLTLWEKNE